MATQTLLSRRAGGTVAAIVGLSALALTLLGPVRAGAETLKACGTEQFVEAVATANANKQANTIELCGSNESVLPAASVKFTDKSGLQTIEGPTSTPGAIRSPRFSATRTFPSATRLVAKSSTTGGLPLAAGSAMQTGFVAKRASLPRKGATSAG